MVPIIFLASFLLWEVVTDSLILYLTEISSTSEEGSKRTLSRLNWARRRLPVDSRVLRALAQAHLNEATKGDREAHYLAAIDALEAASLVAPLDARLDYSLAWLYLVREDEAAAEQAFIEALAKNPFSAEYRYGLGRLRELQGRIEEATELYELVLVEGGASKVRARLDYLNRSVKDVVNE